MLPRDYTPLYRVLTDQPATPAPEVGERLDLGVIQSSTLEIPTPGSVSHTQTTNNTLKTEQKTMSDTMKAVWIGGAFALLVAIIAGLFALNGTSNITINDSGCASVNTGTVSGTINNNCEDGKHAN